MWVYVGFLEFGTAAPRVFRLGGVADPLETGPCTSSVTYQICSLWRKQHEHTIGRFSEEIQLLEYRIATTLKVAESDTVR